MAIPSRDHAVRDDPHGSVRLTLSEQQLFTLAAFKAAIPLPARLRPSSPLSVLNTSPETGRWFSLSFGVIRRGPSLCDRALDKAPPVRSGYCMNHPWLTTTD